VYGEEEAPAAGVADAVCTGSSLSTTITIAGISFARKDKTPAKPLLLRRVPGTTATGGRPGHLGDRVC